MLFHEIGHAVQETNVGNASFRFEPIDFGSKLNYLFNGSTNPHVISVLLRNTYSESYSDCYAAYCIYKKNNDTTIFDKIHEYRNDNDKKLRSKVRNHLNQYSNLEAILLFKNKALNNNNINTYEDVHHQIQLSIVESLKDFLKEELKINDTLLKEIKSYGL